MKVIIAGSRTLSNSHALIQAAVDSSLYHPITEVVSGCARGVDQAGEAWAAAKGIPVRRFPAHWTRYGLSAGYRRNAEMAVYADAAIVLWDGASRGAKNMIDQMMACNKPVHVRIVTTL